ncbi:MAG TPA: hypothetical protein PKW12_13965, partial [Verrucomicrobiota bacterium]|nr:hypothetical protein [Verrucomicrobiota bacterium]
NGPGSGASAPDHFHFQAGPVGSMPFEKEALALSTEHEGLFVRPGLPQQSAEGVIHWPARLHQVSARITLGAQVARDGRDGLGGIEQGIFEQNSPIAALQLRKRGGGITQAQSQVARRHGRTIRGRRARLCGKEAAGLRQKLKRSCHGMAERSASSFLSGRSLPGLSPSSDGSISQPPEIIGAAKAQRAYQKPA